FKKIDAIAPEHTIIVTNSSTIPSSKIASVTERPDKICNMHFFNPPLKMKLVEIVKNDKTSETTVEKVVQLVESINNIAIVLQKEVFGFIVSRIVNVIFDEAIYLYENNVASIEDIDTAIEKGLNHPLGP